MTATQQDWQEFVERWAKSGLREQQAAQPHFIELCHLLGLPTPTEADPDGKFYTFEEHLQKATGGNGRADVWHRGRFAWEYKGKKKNLEDAYAQISAYRGALENPPLLVVCDFLEYRIYPQWTNLSGKPFTFTNHDLLYPEARKFLLWTLTDPDKFRELLDDELKQRSELTEEKARAFADLAEKMRKATDAAGNALWTPMQVARFLTKIVFTMFAEDIDLLPKINGVKVLEYIFERAKDEPDMFVDTIDELFLAMDGKKKQFAGGRVAYFNGGLFKDTGGEKSVDIMHPTLRMHNMRDQMLKLAQADWQKVNPTIFGTLFERALDPSKRAQLGAHYTSESDIRLIVEPVLMEPLYRQWEEIQAQAAPLLQVVVNPDSAPREVRDAEAQLVRLHAAMIQALGSIKVLDPACGSGNFLYVSLRALKDLEEKVRTTFAPVMPYIDVITPRQLYGIEKDEFAAKLAQIVVWIGYLQWRFEHAGQLRPTHTGEKADKPELLAEPIIKDKDDPTNPDEPPRILNDDAILRYDKDGKSYEPEWPQADVIIGNPPFLGGSLLRSELGGKYLEDMWSLYRERIPGGSDLVCYWFEKARVTLEQNVSERVGFISTNSIRGGANRVVLDRIRQIGNIFTAWSDRGWTLDGAAVRVSIIGFDRGIEKNIVLNGMPSAFITSDLDKTVDITIAKPLSENGTIAFRGNQKGGAFDIDATTAQAFLAAPNPSGVLNKDVLKLCWNGIDVTRRPRNVWLIDFGTNMSIETASRYELPFKYVEANVKPVRSNNNRAAYRDRWWIHGEARPTMRSSISKLNRFIVTPHTSSHRLFVWLDQRVMPDHALIVVARDDDYFFGALHS